MELLLDGLCCTWVNANAHGYFFYVIFDKFGLIHKLLDMTLFSVYLFTNCLFIFCYIFNYNQLFITSKSTGGIKFWGDRRCHEFRTFRVRLVHANDITCQIKKRGSHRSPLTVAGESEGDTA